MKKILQLVSLVVCVLIIGTSHAQTIKAAWLTNSGSTLMYSPEGIKKTVQLAKKAGLTHICPVVWNKGYTQYKSTVMQRYIGVSLDPSLKGFDPLQLLITEAHKEGIKVIAWFEFGFAAAYLDSGMHILQRYPHWAARNADGGWVVVNQFTWMNSFHPEVQSFLTQIVQEVVSNYEVDGIQGDDRMPAGPTDGGYDAFTVSEYRKEHNGSYPPSNALDSGWVQWRANKMTAWGKQLYDAVKKIKPGVVVAHAPSIYPWSKEHYLQDWPAWLQQGITDVLMPQVYRYNVEAYKKALDETIGYAGKNKPVLVPGILAALGDGFTMQSEKLKAMVEYNRQHGINGESFFYFEAIQRDPDFFFRQYPLIR